MARCPVSTIIRCPASSWYSTAEPSISRSTVPFPENFCMMKPSPPKKPFPSLFWKKISMSTPESQARKLRFCAITVLPAESSTAIMEPGKLDANAISPSRSAVYRLRNRVSPENIRPNTLPMPPPSVSIRIPSVIHDIAPASQ